MKKQILIITIFTLAIFAGTSFSYGQVNCPQPRVTDCLSGGLDGLHPVPGTEYTYEVDIPTPTGTKSYNWFVTQDPNFIVSNALTTTIDPGDGNGNFVSGVNTAPADASDYNQVSGGTDKIYITWKSFDPATPTFLVIYVTNDDGTLCTTDNLKAYLIEPINAFTLDIANIDATTISAPSVLGWDVQHATCMPDVVSATYNATSGTVDYDYGVSTLYFLVDAANYNDSYQLSMQLQNVNAAEDVTMEWSYNNGTGALDDAALSWNAVTLGGDAATGYTATETILANAGTSGSIGAEGECILVRITLDHTIDATNYFEGLVDQPVTLAIDGLTGDALDIPDVHHVDSGAGCLADGYDNDVANHIVNPRPNVQEVAPVLLPIQGQN